MKRFAAFLLAAIMLLTMLPAAVLAEEVQLEITLKINTEYQDYDMKLITLARANYQVLAPARPFAESMGAEVSWDGATNTVTFTKEGYTAALTIGAENGVKNGESVKLETPAEMINDQAYVPVEFVGGALNFTVLRESYGRFIRLVSKTGLKSTKYNGELKPGMADLVSEVHRDVPTKFEKSNRLDDLLFYTDFKYVPEEELTEERVLDTSHLPSGDVIYTNDDFVDSAGSGETVNGWWKPVEIKDESVDFDRAVQICCTYPPSNTTFFIVKPTKRIEEYVDPKDKYLVKFYVRLVGGGHVDTGAGKVYVHVEESYIPTWIKSVSETVEFGNEWKEVYALATGVENANHIGVTTGFWRQTIEIGGFEVQKLARDADTSMFDAFKKDVDLISPQMSKDAPWRAEALDRIEKMRKGDFKVKVQDKDGKPVENADVTFNMFEHEFKFGGVLDSSFWDDEGTGNWVQRYSETMGVNFNAMGAGNAAKLAYYDGNQRILRRKIDDAKNLGIRYFHAHVLWMPSLSSGHERPYRYYGPDRVDTMDWNTFENYVKNDFNRFITMFPEINEQEVANEMVNRVTWDSKFGPNYLHDLFRWADEIRKKDGQENRTLGYCDNQLNNPKYWEKLDGFQKANVPMEMLFYQGHSYDHENDPLDNARRLSTINETFDRYTYEYGKQFGVTEMSCYSETQEFQADFTRDFLITAFSHPGCESFYIFWPSDVYSGGPASATAGCAPLFDDRFNEKLGLRQWQDLIYNKWWTKDAKTTTDSEGKGSVRGFYGDYDISVTVNGREVKTEMAAFHRGYENELTIVLDDSEL